MALNPLFAIGPFDGYNGTVDPYYLDPGQAQVASNCDISYALGSLSTAQGRALLGTISIPSTGGSGLLPGWTLQGLQQFTTFTGDTTLTTKRLYVFSAVGQNPNNPTQTNYVQGYFNPATGTTTVLPYARPFTQAVQFGSSLWTNGGDWIGYANGAVASDVWQLQVDPKFSYNLFGTYATTAGNAPVDTYTYAITLRKANRWQLVGSAPPYTIYPDLESLQESSPVFTTSVTVTAGQQPGFNCTAALGQVTSVLTSGNTIGFQTWYACVYRSRVGNPTYQFVDYLINMTAMNDHAGTFSVIDTYSDAAIANNAYLTIHHDVPPMIGQTYPGAIANNSAPLALTQQNAGSAFAYANPSFITKHKGRMFAFTLYPDIPLGAGPASSPASVRLQPQLWCSDYGVPWSWNDDSAQNQVLLVGPEDTPGNGSIDSGILTSPPWQPNQIEDTPMGLASTGSYLVLFKSNSTKILLGDSPSEFVVQPAFDIGCISTNSIVPAEGGVFWLAPQGVYFFNGGAPEYLSEDVRGAINLIPFNQQQLGLGSYNDKTYYLSFAQAGITFAYYLPSKKWYTLPYGASLAVSSQYNATSLVISGPAGALWNVASPSPALDLGQPIVATWQSGVSDSGAPSQLKDYRYLQLLTAIQPGTVQVTLTLDPNAAITNVYTATFDTSKGNGAHIVSLPAGLVGYEAMLTVQLTTNPAATAPLQVRKVVLLGDVRDAVQAPPTSDCIVATLNGAQVYPALGS